jgi:hypothetical protein
MIQLSHKKFLFPSRVGARMSAGDEITTPGTKPEAVSMAEIHAMRQMAEAVRAPLPVL